MVLAAVVVVVAVAAGGVAGRPDGTADTNDKNPVFNIWEFAISNTRYNPTRRNADKSDDPCTTAIISCCRTPDRASRDHCFSQYGCPGAWFNNLCSERFTGLVRKGVEQAFARGF